MELCKNYKELETILDNSGFNQKLSLLDKIHFRKHNGVLFIKPINKRYKIFLNFLEIKDTEKLSRFDQEFKIFLRDGFTYHELLVIVNYEGWDNEIIVLKEEHIKELIEFVIIYSLDQESAMELNELNKIGGKVYFQFKNVR